MQRLRIILIRGGHRARTGDDHVFEILPAGEGRRPERKRTALQRSHWIHRAAAVGVQKITGAARAMHVIPVLFALDDFVAQLAAFVGGAQVQESIDIRQIGLRKIYAAGAATTVPAGRASKTKMIFTHNARNRAGGEPFEDVSGEFRFPGFIHSRIQYASHRVSRQVFSAIDVGSTARARFFFADLSHAFARFGRIMKR